MNRLPLYQVDAFADAVFQGNPAAVCPLSEWLGEEMLQSIAAENNLAETAFFLWPQEVAPLRWFTPRAEVPLCGHATLAAGAVILSFLAPERESIDFTTSSGALTVRRRQNGFEMDFPALDLEPVKTVPDPVRRALNVDFEEVWVCHEDLNYFVILGSEDRLKACRPDLALLEELHPCGVAVSAPGSQTDIASRYFAPSFGIPEDPVTGSIHCALAPYWAGRLRKTSLSALQLSARRGRLGLEVKGNRVLLSGAAACYLRGEIFLP